MPPRPPQLAAWVLRLLIPPAWPEELVSIRSELEQRQRRFIEETQMADHQRQRLVREWDELGQAREERMVEFAQQMRVFGEQYQRVNSALASLETVGERLQREQHEVTELQRLSEERQRSHIEEWEAQGEKRWQREKLLWEQQWHDHDRRNAEHVERLREVQELTGLNEEQITYLWDLITEDVRLQTQDVQNRMIKISERIEANRRRNR